MGVERRFIANLVGTFLCLVVPCLTQETHERIGRSEIFRRPCIDNSVLQDLTSHYPVPLGLSPDGNQILMRTLNSSGRYGLSTVDRATHRTEHEMTWPEPILRVEWSADSTEISFFAMSRYAAGRTLYVWNLQDDKVRKLDTPFTVAQPQVKWSPDSILLAFSDAELGLVIVHTRAEGPPIVFHKKVLVFDWLNDSSTVALVDEHDPATLDFVEIATGKERAHRITPGDRIFEVVGSPGGKSILVISQDPSHAWLLEKMDTQVFRTSVLVHSTQRIGSPVWLSDRLISFQTTDGGSVKIVVHDVISRKSSTLEDLGGVNSIRAILRGPGGDEAIAVAHQGDRPVSLYALPITGSKSVILASSESKSLPAVPAESAFATSRDGTKVPLIIWRAQPQLEPPAALIRIRGGIGTQLPVWEEHIQIFVKHRFHFVGVNYRGETGTAEQRVDDILAAIEYTHQRLHVPYERIVVLGHSSGAGLVAAACAQQPSHCGFVVLVAAGAADDDLPIPREKAKLLHLIVFYPAYDPVPRQEVVQNLARLYSEGSLHDQGAAFYQFPDDHNLMYPSSWAAVYSAILAQFHQGDCAERN